MTHIIQFGTSGYRGIIGDTFTDHEVSQIVAAISRWMIKSGSKRLFIGYDPRTGNGLQPGQFLSLACGIAEQFGLESVVADMPVPTPLVSWAVRYGEFDGGLIFTASHNPPEYNGLKFNPKPGGPATIEVTSEIEALLRAHSAPVQQRYSIHQVDNLTPRFVDFVAQYVYRLGYDPFPFNGVIDSRHGSAWPIWNQMATTFSFTILDALHTTMDPCFGGIEPNPTDPAALRDLARAVRQNSAHIGVGHDPDADRHAIVDETGAWVSPEMMSAIILLDWYERGIQCDGIVSTVASSGVVRSICEYLGKPYYETPVGFKYFAPYFNDASCRLIGVESSGGFSVSDYLFEKCGFLPALLVAAISSQKNKSVSQLVNEIKSKVGVYFFKESKFTFDPTKRNYVLSGLERLESIPMMVGPVHVNTIDGKKWSSDLGWVLIRLSGTEPVGRIYCEAQSNELASRWQEFAMNWARQYL